MQADLGGRVALVLGGLDRLADAVAALLRANGAETVRVADPAGAAARVGEADMLIHLAPSVSTGSVLSSAATSMAARGGGRIVTVASVFGLVPMRGRAEAAADAGTFAQTRAMALEWAGAGVLVNAIAVLGPDADAADTRAHVPLGRVALEAEVANAVLFLLAPASRYMVGHVLTLDGGWSCGFARDF